MRLISGFETALVEDGELSRKAATTLDLGSGLASSLVSRSCFPLHGIWLAKGAHFQPGSSVQHSPLCIAALATQRSNGEGSEDRSAGDYAGNDSNHSHLLQNLPCAPGVHPVCSTYSTYSVTLTLPTYSPFPLSPSAGSHVSRTPISLLFDWPTEDNFASRLYFRPATGYRSAWVFVHEQVHPTT